MLWITMEWETIKDNIMKERYSKHDFKSMKVFKIWNVSPQDMLDEIIRIDKQCHDNPSEQYKPTFYISKSLEYIREVYSHIWIVTGKHSKS